MEERYPGGCGGGWARDSVELEGTRSSRTSRVGGRERGDGESRAVATFSDVLEQSTSVLLAPAHLSAERFPKLQPRGPLNHSFLLLLLDRRKLRSFRLV